MANSRHVYGNGNHSVKKTISNTLLEEDHIFGSGNALVDIDFYSNSESIYIKIDL